MSTSKPRYKLVDWVEKNKHKLDMNNLSINCNAIDYLLRPENIDFINWDYFSINPNAINILKEKKNYNKINFKLLSSNNSEEAIKLLEENEELIDFYFLSSNKYAIRILEKNLEKVNINSLLQNPNAIELIKKITDDRVNEYLRYHTINWDSLLTLSNEEAIFFFYNELGEDKVDEMCLNSKAINFLEKNQNLIDWFFFSGNSSPKAIKLLKENPSKIDYWWLSSNPNALEILKENQDKINWSQLSLNKNIFVLEDYNEMKENFKPMANEILEKALNPDRLLKLMNKYKLTYEEILKIF